MKKHFLVLAFVAVACVGCSAHPNDYIDRDNPPKPPGVHVSAKLAAVKRFYFVMAPGVGEWNLEPLLLNARIDVNGKVVSAEYNNIPYYGRTSSEMVENHVLVEGTYNPETGEIDAKYTITNTEKSPALTYVQAGHGTIKGTVDNDVKFIPLTVEGSKSSVVMENGRETSRIDKKTSYTFSPEVKQ